MIAPAVQRVALARPRLQAGGSRRRRQQRAAAEPDQQPAAAPATQQEGLPPYYSLSLPVYCLATAAADGGSPSMCLVTYAGEAR